MQRFWSYIAVQLGKHAIVVTVVGLLVTIALGLGITQLNFATGQDSYLNKNEQVYKDNVVYQRLFGGEAMLTVISMDPGHKIDELFTGDGAQQLTDFHDRLRASGEVESVVSPLTILRFSDAWSPAPTATRPTASRPRRCSRHRRRRPPGRPPRPHAAKTP